MVRGKATKWQQSTFVTSERIYTNLLGRNKRKDKKNLQGNGLKNSPAGLGPCSLMVVREMGNNQPE